MKRFAMCFAVALLVSLFVPFGPPSPWPIGYDAFFRLAWYMCVVLLLAFALYAAVLFVEWILGRRRS